MKGLQLDISAGLKLSFGSSFVPSNTEIRVTRTECRGVSMMVRGEHVCMWSELTDGLRKWRSERDATEQSQIKAINRFGYED